MSTVVPDESALAGRNLELKCRVADLDAARRAVLALGATPLGPERQVDRYFAVPAGRLKLRRSTRDGAHLIAYVRPDLPGARAARFHRLPVDDPDALEEMLAAMLGDAGRVEKDREVWWWREVRIHLDRVAGRGTFVELEARLDRIDDAEEAARRVERLREALGLLEPVAGSYREMPAGDR